MDSAKKELSGLWNNKQMMHVIAEVVVFFGLIFYFSSQNKKLTSHIESLAQRIEEQEDLLQKSEKNGGGKREYIQHLEDRVLTLEIQFTRLQAQLAQSQQASAQSQQASAQSQQTPQPKRSTVILKKDVILEEDLDAELTDEINDLET
jgi:septal ring factor EnvC (AmiA/AmiB activator)